jgi:hypothetical protein
MDLRSCDLASSEVGDEIVIHPLGIAKCPKPLGGIIRYGVDGNLEIGKLNNRLRVAWNPERF